MHGSIRPKRKQRDEQTVYHVQNYSMKKSLRSVVDFIWCDQTSLEQINTNIDLEKPERV